MSGVLLVLAIALVATVVGLLLGILVARVITRRLDEPEEETGP
jgi:uncharacterized membrane-anchored protein YhcB (DUF1043 family)